jgi:hypothetical protein
VPFTLPDDLARRCLDRLGVPAPVDEPALADLVEALGRAMPTGNTTKLDAIGRGEPPPGADPAQVAAAWLAHPGWSWSCWGVATVFAALVNAGGRLAAEVVGARRIGPGAPPVDVHSVVVVTDGDRRWLTDPFFWLGPIEAPGGDRLRPGGWGEAFQDGQAWRTTNGSCAGRSVARYRTFTLPLTAGDVEALCRISVTHTGVSDRPRAMLATVDGSVAASLDRDGVVRLRRWRVPAGRVWGVDPEVAELASWAEAEHAIVETAVDPAARAPQLRADDVLPAERVGGRASDALRRRAGSAGGLDPRHRGTGR